MDSMTVHDCARLVLCTVHKSIIVSEPIDCQPAQGLVSAQHGWYGAGASRGGDFAVTL